jgi:hypothetical protein
LGGRSETSCGKTLKNFNSGKSGGRCVPRIVQKNLTQIARMGRETVGKKQYAHSAADLSRMIQFLPRRGKQKGFGRRESQPRVQEYI